MECLGGWRLSKPDMRNRGKENSEQTKQTKGDRCMVESQY